MHGHDGEHSAHSDRDAHEQLAGRVNATAAAVALAVHA